MLEVEYKGANSVVISSKKAKIVTDPKLSLVGLKDASVKGMVELATEARFMIQSEDAVVVFEGPGEYGVADFDIRGIAAQRHLDTENDPKIATMYRIETGDFKVGVIGNIYEKLSEEQLEGLGVLDVLIIPVGGNGYTLDPAGAASIVRQVEPKIVVPIHYHDDALKYEVPQLELDLFIKELGVAVEESAKLKLKNAGALPASMTVCKLSRS